MELKHYVALRRIRREELKRQQKFLERTVLCMGCMNRTDKRCKVCAHCDRLVV